MEISKERIIILLICVLCFVSLGVGYQGYKWTHTPPPVSTIGCPRVVVEKPVYIPSDTSQMWKDVAENYGKRLSDCTKELTAKNESKPLTLAPQVRVPICPPLDPYDCQLRHSGNASKKYSNYVSCNSGQLKMRYVCATGELIS